MDNVCLCQSCSMPMDGKEDLRGTEADGKRNDDYCVYCYKDGAFTDTFSMEEMIETCVPHMVSANPGMTEDAARQSMRGFFPQLKRWRQAQ